jgi:ribosomal protein L7/L12
MLDETEWQELTPFLDSHVKAIQAYRQKTGLGIREAREHMAEELAPTFWTRV